MPDDRRKRSARSFRLAFRSQVEVLERRELLSLGPSSLGDLAHGPTASTRTPPLVASGDGLPGLADSANVEQATRTANQMYLKTLEDQLAGGPIAATRNRALLRELDRGGPRAAVVGQLLKTPKVASWMARNTYFQLFGSTPTRAQSRRLASVLRTDGLEPGLVLALAGPTYYHSRGGGSDAGFVASLYQELVGRAPTAAESAHWVRRLEHGGSRAGVVRAVLKDPQARAFLATPALVIRDGTVAGDSLNRAVLTMRRTGGLNRLVSQAYASESYFASAAYPPDPAPLLTDSTTVTDHPPGLPMAPGFDLGTRWVRESQNGAVEVGGESMFFIPSTAITAAPDGSLWFTGPSENYASARTVYRLAEQPGQNTPTWQAVLTNQFLQFVSISAVSQDLWWAAYTDSAAGQTTTYIASFNSGGATIAIYDPPAGETPVMISAASDGTVWLLTQSNHVYSLNTAEQQDPGAWTQVDSGGYTITNLSVGAANNIYAVGHQGNSPLVLLSYGNGSWQVDPSFPQNVVPQTVTATADGSTWVVAADLKTVYLRSLGTWFMVQNQDPGGAIQLVAGLDRYRMAALVAEPDGNPLLETLSVGITAQPATPFPPMDPGEQLGYAYISQQLSIPNDNIRSEYGNLNFDPGTASSFISHNLVIAPPNVSAQDWADIKNQIVAELTDLGNVRSFFTNLNDMNGWLNTTSNTALTSAYSYIGQANNSTDTTSTVSLFLEALLEAAMAGISSALTGGGAIVAAVASSALSSVLSDMTNNPNPNSNTALSSTYANLENTTENYYLMTEEKNGEYEQNIVSDWGKLQAVNKAVLGPWYWDTTQTQTLAELAAPADTLFYYQALMPVKWQIVEYINTYCGPGLLNPFCDEDGIPTYDIYQVDLGSHDGYEFYNDFFINQKGANTNIVSGSTGPYPSQDLINEIYGMGVSQSTLFQGLKGWDLSVIVVPLQSF